MANHKGSEGAVYIAANQVAEVKSWSFDESSDTVEDTVMGETAKTRQSTLTDASGSMECFWDETDTTGQGAMTIGAEVTLNLYPEGNTSGDTYYTGSVIITGIGRSGSFDGMVEASYSFEANGGISSTTV